MELVDSASSILVELIFELNLSCRQKKNFDLVTEFSCQLVDLVDPMVQNCFLVPTIRRSTKTTKICSKFVSTELFSEFLLSQIEETLFDPSKRAEKGFLSSIDVLIGIFLSSDELDSLVEKLIFDPCFVRLDENLPLILTEKVIENFCSSRFVLRENETKFVLTFLIENFRFARRDASKFFRLVSLLEKFVGPRFRSLEEKFSDSEFFVSMRNFVEILWKICAERNELVVGGRVRATIFRLVAATRNFSFDEIRTIFNENSLFARREANKIFFKFFSEDFPSKKHFFEIFLRENRRVDEFLRDFPSFRRHADIFLLEKFAEKPNFNEILPKIDFFSLVEKIRRQNFAIESFSFQRAPISSNEHFRAVLLAAFLFGEPENREKIRRYENQFDSTFRLFFPQFVVFFLSEPNETNQNALQQIFNKNQFVKLLKSNLTFVLLQILQTFRRENDQNSSISRPSNSWKQIGKIFELIRQILNVKLFQDLVVKHAVRSTENFVSLF